MSDLVKQLREACLVSDDLADKAADLIEQQAEQIKVLEAEIDELKSARPVCIGCCDAIGESALEAESTDNTIPFKATLLFDHETRVVTGRMSMEAESTCRKNKEESTHETRHVDPIDKLEAEPQEPSNTTEIERLKAEIAACKVDACKVDAERYWWLCNFG
jgi:hypothetical protein